MANSPIIYGPNGATSLVSGGVTLPGSTSGTIQIQPSAITTNYALTLPGAQGGSSTTLSNNGSGTLSWVAGLPAVGTDGQLLKSMNSTYVQSSYYTPYVNYVGNAFSEVNTNGWATYSNTASNIPVNGTGGTATGLTFSRTTSSPLRGSACFSIAQTNSTSLQGKGVSYNFTIDPTDQAKALSVQFDFNASSTFVAGNGSTPPLNDGTTTTNAGNSDLEVFIYDVTNSALIYVSPQVITANGANNFTFKGTFQTPSNSVSYRFIIHAATTSANATGYTFKFTNVYVGPQVVVQGTPLTDWIDYTGVVGATTTAPTYGTTVVNKWSWRRVGDSMEIRVSLRQSTGGTSGSGFYLWPLPSGYTIDTTKVSIPSSSTTVYYPCLGSFLVSEGGTTHHTGQVSAYNSTNLILQGIYAGSGTGIDPTIGSIAASLSIANSSYTFTAFVPIAGWSSSTLMSNDADTRVVAASYYASGTQSVSTTQPANFDTKLWDTHGAVTTGASWKFTAPVSGFYVASGFVESSSSAGAGWVIYKNGVAYKPAADPANAQYGSGFSVQVQLNAGEYLDFRKVNSGSITGGAAGGSGTSFMDVTRISGPASIAANEKVLVKYRNTTNFASTISIPINFDTKITDSHSAVTVSVSAWKFTAPISTTYIVCGSIGTTGASSDIRLFKNGSQYEYIGVTYNTYTTLPYATEIPLLAGDYLDIRLSPSVSTNGGTAGSTHISISSV